MSFAIHVIPDVGDPVYRTGFSSSVVATATARAEARRLFKQGPTAQKIEIVTVETLTRESLQQDLITRENQFETGAR